MRCFHAGNYVARASFALLVGCAGKPVDFQSQSTSSAGGSSGTGGTDYSSNTAAGGAGDAPSSGATLTGGSSTQGGRAGQPSTSAGGSSGTGGTDYSSNTAAGGAGDAPSSGGTSPTGGAFAQGGTAGQPSTTGTGCAKSRLESVQTSNGTAACVAKLVTVGTGDNTFGIDATEVTIGQYNSWLATSPELPPSTDTQCGWNTSYFPPASSVGPNQDTYPVGVDWCDAYAYCTFAGKRLCGKIGGGPNPPNSFADASMSQWYAACSSGGIYSYPYGNTHDPAACNSSDHWSPPPPMLLPVASLESCQSSVSGYTGVYDLSGNAVEWEDNCRVTVYAGNTYVDCKARGGSAGGGDTPDATDQTWCTFEHSLTNPPQSIAGFRCCSG
jgi:formylglycine-generating enzyme